MKESLYVNEILTRDEVMELLKIGRSTFYDLIQSGKLKAFKEGNRYKVPASAVQNYIRDRMQA